MIVRSSGSMVTISLDEPELDLLGQIPTLLASVGGEDDPANAVMRRSAHRDDAGASSEFAELVEDEMATTRAADRAVVDAVASGMHELSRDDAIRVLRSVNEARLVLAARTGVLDGGPGWEARASSDPVIAALSWLGYFESELLRALPTVH
jgi:hypothetical protein